MKELAKKPYLLYVGNAYPHKNLKRLILAFRKLIEEGLDCNLVLVTNKGQFNHFNQVKRSPIEEKIIFTDFISDDELDKLYKDASLYVFPSLYEGFGLPALEAMARGVPVISSNTTCLPEILGIGAIYFNPLDINDIAEKIKKTLLDNRVKDILIKKGFEQVKKYSWQKMAKETLSVYEGIPQ